MNKQNVIVIGAGPAGIFTALELYNKFGDDYAVTVVDDRPAFANGERFPEAERVVCQVHYMPTYLFSHYRSLGYEKGLCPVAERTYACLMSVPMYPKLTDADAQDVIHAVKKVAANYAV